MKLKDYLKKNGITGQWFAAQIPISGPYLSLIINNKAIPSRVVMFRIRDLTEGAVKEKDFNEK